FILADNRAVVPSNVDQGYILRRFIRRAVRHARLLGITNNFCSKIAETIINLYSDEYNYLLTKKEFVIKQLDLEETKFRNTLENGLKEFNKLTLKIIPSISEDTAKSISNLTKGISELNIPKLPLPLISKDVADSISKFVFAVPKLDVNLSNLSIPRIPVESFEKLRDTIDVLNKRNMLPQISDEALKIISSLTNVIMQKETAFLLFQSYGFPIEIITEIAKEKAIVVDVDSFNSEYQKHQELSRVGAEKKFKGGLSDASEITIKYHTTTHILNQALRNILSKDIRQKGSNITSERLRFDFNFDRKLTEVEIKAIENEVNNIISKDLEVKKQLMKLEDAFSCGAQAEFGARYPEEVFVYSIGDYSKEICMGPHVENTKELGKFKIIKEEAVAAGIRRIKGVLE
ncbi:MAG: alanine--tRNA ligase-related protein, partial [archaeon]